MKKKIETPKLIIVTKDNFQLNFIDFKNSLKDKYFQYIIINNQISTSNQKIIEKEGEIVFSEFTICYKSKNQNKNFKTYFIPSIKYHRYSEDEIASFNSTFLNYLSNKNNIYNFNYIYNSNSLSYENINKREKLENNLDAILKDGKPFNDENKKSYNYFPKAIELPGKKFQNLFENYLKYFIEQNFDENKKIIFIKNENEKNSKEIYAYESNIYETNYKLVNRILDFKWGVIYEIYDNNLYKLTVDEYKINYMKDKNKLRSDFINFIQKLSDFFNNVERNKIEFMIDIKHSDFNEDLFQNWKDYFISENMEIEFKYKIIEDKKASFQLTAKKSWDIKDKYKNITKFLNFILSIKENYKKQKEFKLENILYRRFNMRNLFPLKAQKYIKFSYHLIPNILYGFRLKKDKDYYISKVNYKNLLIHNKNQEEILFKYKIEPYLRELFEINNKNSNDIINKFIIKRISIEFAKDLEVLLNDKNFDKQIKIYFAKLDFSLFEPKHDNYRTINYELIKKPDFKDEEFIKYFESLIELAKDIKKKNLIDEEIGITLFYKAIYDKDNINIYGTNLKNKIIFPIKNLLLNTNEEEEINKIVNKINIYDISYICMKNNINFYLKYSNLENEQNLKDLTMTQKLGYIIEENNILNNRDKLKEYKNKFFSDEIEKVENKYYLNIKRKKFYKKADEIINILKNKTDFTINTNSDNKKIFQINFIDQEKFNEIDNITKEINKI